MIKKAVSFTLTFTWFGAVVYAANAASATGTLQYLLGGHNAPRLPAVSKVRQLAVPLARWGNIHSYVIVKYTTKNFGQHGTMMDLEAESRVENALLHAVLQSQDLSDLPLPRKANTAQKVISGNKIFGNILTEESISNVDIIEVKLLTVCLLYTSPSPRD